MDWMPIKTAPKDRILLYLPAITGCSHPSNNQPALIEIGFGPRLGQRYASHWMPLPTPPGTKRAEENAQQNFSDNG